MGEKARSLKLYGLPAPQSIGVSRVPDGEDAAQLFDKREKLVMVLFHRDAQTEIVDLIVQGVVHSKEEVLQDSPQGYVRCRTVGSGMMLATFGKE